MLEYLAWIQRVGLFVLVAGSALVLWALFADRVRGRGKVRRRCQRCWYDMSQTRGLSCPECGRTARHADHLVRPRRLWGRAVLGFLLVIIGLPCSVSTAFVGESSLRYVPGRVLVALLEPTTPAFHLGTSVQVTPALSREQDQILTEITRRAQNFTLSNAARKALAAHQFSGTEPLGMRMRTRWAAGVPIRVLLIDRFSSVVPRQVKAAARIPGMSTLRMASAGYSMNRYGPSFTPGTVDGGSQRLGIVPPETTEIVFDVVVSEGALDVWTGTHTQPITIVDSIADILAPVRAPGATAAIRTEIARSLIISPDAGIISLAYPADFALTDVCVAIRVEFVHAGAVQANSRAQWRLNAAQIQLMTASRTRGAGDPHDLAGLLSPSECTAALEGNLDALRAGVESPEGWTIRVVPDEEMALADVDAASYWDGLIELPLADVLKNTAGE